MASTEPNETVTIPKEELNEQLRKMRVDMEHFRDLYRDRDAKFHEVSAQAAQDRFASQEAIHREEYKTRQANEAFECLKADMRRIGEAHREEMTSQRQKFERAKIEHCQERAMYIELLTEVYEDLATGPLKLHFPICEACEGTGGTPITGPVSGTGSPAGFVGPEYKTIGYMNPEESPCETCFGAKRVAS